MRNANHSSVRPEDPLVTHRNAPLTVEGRHRLVGRCQTRPIAHVAAEMGISRACASKWVHRYRLHGDTGLEDRPSVPHSQPTATPPVVVARIEQLRRDKKWSARRIQLELTNEGVSVSTRTVGRVLERLGLNLRRFIDPNGDDNRKPTPIIARWPGHMVHVDVKKVGRIPDGGGWRAPSSAAAPTKPRPSTGRRNGPVSAPATSTSTRSSTVTHGWHTPSRCPTSGPRPPSGSCAGR